MPFTSSSACAPAAATAATAEATICWQCASVAALFDLSFALAPREDYLPPAIPVLCFQRSALLPLLFPSPTHPRFKTRPQAYHVGGTCPSDPNKMRQQQVRGEIMTSFRDMVKKMDMGCRVRQGREVTACIRSAGSLRPTYQGTLSHSQQKSRSATSTST